MFEELIPFDLSVTCVKVDFLVCFQGTLVLRSISPWQLVNSLGESVQ